MDQTTVVNASINRRVVTLRKEWYWGLAFGLIIQNQTKDLIFTLILPALAIELDIEKKDRTIQKL